MDLYGLSNVLQKIYLDGFLRDLRSAPRARVQWYRRMRAGPGMVSRMADPVFTALLHEPVVNTRVAVHVTALQPTGRSSR